MDKSIVQVGEKVTATFSIDWLDQEGGWIGLFEKGAGDADYITYKKYSFSNKVLTDNTFEVVMDTPGDYEFRMFKDYYGTYKLATSGRIEVVPREEKQGEDSKARFNTLTGEVWVLSPPEMIWRPANANGLGAITTFDKQAEANAWIHSGSPSTLNHETVIVLQVGNPMMVLNTVSQEIDPGLGTKPTIIGGRTLLPIRAVIEALGGSVGWVGSEKKVTLMLGATTMELWINQKTAKVNGQTKSLDVAPTTINGRTIIPVRFVAENFGAGVEWSSSNSKIYITYYP